jgi:hypothetical protein
MEWEFSGGNTSTQKKRASLPGILQDLTRDQTLYVTLGGRQLTA